MTSTVSEVLDSNLRHVLRAARARVEAGHNDTCCAVVLAGADCSCGHDALIVATFEHDAAYGRDQ